MAVDLGRHGEVLGALRDVLTDAAAVEFARRVTGDPAATLARWWIDPVDYEFGTPTTLGAVRVRGTTADGATWSAFVKVVQGIRHWPLIDTLPPELRQGALDSPLWRYEPDLYTSTVGELLPTGLSLPVLHAVLDLGDDRVAIVLQDIAIADVGWDDDRFARAARLLGRLAVRITRTDALPACAPRMPGENTRRFYDSHLRPFRLPALTDETLWTHPVLTAWPGRRRQGLLELASRIPAILEQLDRLPHVDVAHGDASPQNLLIPASATDAFVAIDWSLGGNGPVGEELAQLLIGLAHAGQLTVAELGHVREHIIDAYLQGLGDEGYRCDREDVGRGLDGTLAVRSAFTAIPLDRLGEPRTDGLDELLRNRLELTSYLCDLGLAIPMPKGRPAE